MTSIGVDPAPGGLPDGTPEKTAAELTLELARAERRQARKEQWRLLRRRPGFIIGCLILLFWLVCAIGGDHITPFDPINDLAGPFQRPGGSHWFGTDDLGRDVLSRVMAGARDILIVAFIAASVATVVGSMLGLIMGYVRGVADEAIGRVIEAVLSIPVILIGLLIISLLGASKPVVILTVAVLFTPIVARTVRTAVLNEAQLDYVEAAKLRGESGLYIMTREILRTSCPSSSWSSPSVSGTPSSPSPRSRSWAPASRCRRLTGG